jgi:hypothetical protein
MLNKSSPLKLLGQMEPNLAGSELLLAAMFIGRMEPNEEAL